MSMICPKCRQRLEEIRKWYCRRCDELYNDEEAEKGPEGLIAEYRSTSYWHRKSPALISLFDDHVKLNLFDDNPSELVVRYDQIESLDIRPMREITALRTFLVGPVLAALWKKEKRLLTIGFRDSAGLIVTPTFDVGETAGEEDECYQRIHEKIAASR